MVNKPFKNQEVTIIDSNLRTTDNHLVGRIFNIQRYSLNDGLGIRTVIFFKGCPHHCPWCANPESMSRKIQFVRRKSKCIRCTRCENDVIECPSGAFEQIGKDISLDELLKLIEKDLVFFRSSNGGVTLSGGEVLLQANFARHLLSKLQQLGINTAIETAGDVKFDDIWSVAQYCDEVLFDLKIMDPKQAKTVINMHQRRVLDNFKRLYELGVKLTPRLPLIPGYTLNKDNIAAILAFLKPLHKIQQIDILPFHQYGESKYQLINQPYTMSAINSPTEHEISTIQTWLESHGYRVTVGG